MPPLRTGFNPHIVPHNRKQLVNQLRDIVDVAKRLEFQVVELNLDSVMYELGLRTFFDADFIEVLNNSPTRFHLNVFRDAPERNWPTLTDPNSIDRSVALRQFVQIVEFFEQNHTMEMYVVHPGRQITADSNHLDALVESLQTIHSLFPGLPIAVENTNSGAVLHAMDSVLAMLDSTTSIRFALHTGRAFHSVEANHIAFESRLDYMGQFTDRMAEIRWHNTAPGQRPSVPLHVGLERGIDLHKVMRSVGRNPGTVHMIDTVGLNPASLLREIRVLRGAMNA